MSSIRPRPAPLDRARGRVVAFVALAAAVRAWVAFRTAMPERDAAHYLWMADGLTCGEPERLFRSVFHPVFPALIGGLRALSPALDPVVAGQVVACVASALAVWPLYRLTERLFGDRAAIAAGLCFALGSWFVRHPADVLSEAVFHPLVATGAWLLVGPARSRSAAALGAGLCAAVAYGVRPEGATLGVAGVVWLWFVGAPRAALACAAGCAAALVFPLGWSELGPGFTLTPKAAFVWSDGVGMAHGGGVGHYLRQAVDLPGAMLESIGFVAAPAAVLGAVLALRDDRRREAWLLLAPFTIQLVVVPILRTNPRFLSGYGILMLPFAGLAWARLRPALTRRHLVAVAVVATFAVDLARLPAVRRADRLVERELGAWLRTRLTPGERVVSDMPRLEYFAGVEPGPPRDVTPRERELAAADPRVRCVVWVEARTGLSPDALAAVGFVTVTLPPHLAASAIGRGIALVARPR